MRGEACGKCRRQALGLLREDAWRDLRASKRQACSTAKLREELEFCSVLPIAAAVLVDNGGSARCY